MGGDGAEGANRRWQAYSEASVVGTGVRVLAANAQGEVSEAERLQKNLKKASAKALVRGAAAAANVGVAVGTCGTSLVITMPAIVATQVTIHAHARIWISLGCGLGL